VIHFQNHSTPRTWRQRRGVRTTRLCCTQQRHSSARQARAGAVTSIASRTQRPWRSLCR